MKKIFTLLLLVCPFFQSCENKTGKKDLPASENQKSNARLDTVSLENPGKPIEYSIRIEKTDSAEYQSSALKINRKKDQFEKITDFKKVKKLLKGIVEFAEDGENQTVQKIHFRNGKEYANTNEYNYFLAYFPEEDVLLCEGGHTIDVSFDLKNGKQTAETGNPDLIISSPRKDFRINGYFGGQECYFYFLQRRMNGKFEKIIQLNEAFEKQKMQLCTIGHAFWLDDQTFYLTESSDFIEERVTKRYFRIKITGL